MLIKFDCTDPETIKPMSCGGRQWTPINPTKCYGHPYSSAALGMKSL